MTALARFGGRLRRRGPTEIVRRDDTEDRRLAASQRTALLAEGKVFRMRVDPRADELYRRWLAARARYDAVFLAPGIPSVEDMRAANSEYDAALTADEREYLALHPPASIQMRDTLGWWARRWRDARVWWLEFWSLSSRGYRFRTAIASVRRRLRFRLYSFRARVARRRFS